ncbi:MAG: hypothetical protein Q8922_02860 [Bacteroidota bacterium]|nr:hypothetical protein [Bacteroidota bacterium]MDP4232906.1 hypothetical protein [Bacteroidota bacterium]MDP4241950.1 hypothetical protein [Bacteroidota bacterium]MDP4286853.1 hypothetical protein [Bacteroidota bacterium]
MNKPRTEQPNLNEYSATTTEELIVQYLDGELHRKELESVLFGRLAQSEDARTLMREHLIVRGAIRASADHELFQLSESLDRKTRSRIEQVLQVMTPEQQLSYAGDAPAVRTNLISRRLNRWALRPSLAVLVLLLAIGTTWFVTRTTDTRIATNQPAQTPTVTAPVPTAPAQQIAPQSAVQQPMAALPVQHAEASHRAAMRSTSATKSSMSVANQQQLASNGSFEPKTETRPGEPTMDELNPSKRFAKILNASEKREVVVTSHDRL